MSTVTITLPKGIFKHPKSKFLHMRYFFQGKPRAESTGETDPKKALEKRKDRLAELRMDKAKKLDFVPNTQLRVSDLLDSLEADFRLRQVKSLEQIQSHLKPLREMLGSRRAQDISPDTIDDYIEARRQKKKANGTINRETTLLGQAYRLGIETKKLRTVPMMRRLSEEGTRREGFFEAAEFQAVLSHLPEYLKGFAKFGYLSDWRKSEIRSLQWTLVDMLGRTIRLHPKKSKNKKGRVLVLAGELWDVIERQWKMREFQNSDGTVGIAAGAFSRGTTSLTKRTSGKHCSRPSNICGPFPRSNSRSRPSSRSSRKRSAESANRKAKAK
jgi:integrase